MCMYKCIYLHMCAGPCICIQKTGGCQVSSSIMLHLYSFVTDLSLNLKFTIFLPSSSSNPSSTGVAGVCSHDQLFVGVQLRSLFLQGIAFNPLSHISSPRPKGQKQFCITHMNIVSYFNVYFCMSTHILEFYGLNPGVRVYISLYLTLFNDHILLPCSILRINYK